MRASPAIHVHVSRFDLWLAAVGLLLVAAAASLGAWLWLRREIMSMPALGLAAGAGAASLAMAATLLGRTPRSLRWDTQQWHLGPVSASGDEPWSGRITVAVDLGGWMLLRFEHDAPRPGRRTTWLPVQRLGLGAQWHALRCAVYSARPATGPDATEALRRESPE